ncbi:hypothetical protein BGZ83_010736 [Gryganskiella cystojenkinii]|nr:hypothetical protein BGZ83_010736 [Gryganskiella cystojenkinii]
MSEDSLIILGTPLPQIKKTDAFGDLQKRNPTRDQEVRDEQGRRRFHGAFTGGFSAGYYNTVGSKEGWTPSEFVSSRNKRSEKKLLRPEDFMDEEDKQLMADSSRLVAKDDFDTLGSTQKEIEKKRAAARNMQASGGVLGALPDSIIDDLVVPSSEPVGIRLLKKMGWKPGQGIGPRVTKRVRMQQQVEDNDSMDVDLPVNMTFAPIDSAIVMFTNKANHFGIGYDPYKDAPEFDRSMKEKSDSKYLSGSAGGDRKIGFGFGSLDGDDDEDDIYGSGPGPTLSLSTIEHHDKPKSGRSRKQEDSSTDKRPKGEDLVPRYCHDGRPPLRGYVLASKDSQTEVKWFEPPKVPKDFVPRHVFTSEELNRRAYPGVSSGPIRRGDPNQQQPKLTADDRALVLGETPIDAPKRSVFEYMSAENKNRLDNLLGFVIDTEGEKHMRKDLWSIPKLEPSAAMAALQGYIPFGDNVAKQNRYKLYLNVQAGLEAEGEKAIQKVEGFTGEDMNKELNEFAQAARIFKPLTSTMATRFTSGTKAVEYAEPPVAAGLRTAAEIKAAAKDSPARSMVVERMEVPKSQAAKAAAMGMFGKLTRTTTDFYPVKLLCKRFHVANPHPDHQDPGKGDSVKDLLDRHTMDSMMINRRQDEGIDEVGEKTAAAEGAKKEAEEKEEIERKKQEEEDRKQAEQQVVQERPPMDIFKAIFDDSDSEDESGDDDNDEEEEKSVAVVVPGPEELRKPEREVDMVEKEDEKPDDGKPFRPMFTKRTASDRSSSKSGPSRAPKAIKLDLDDDHEEEDEDVMGPKLSIPKPKVAAGTKRSVTRRKEEDDDQQEEYKSVLNEEVVMSDDDDMIGPMPPPPPLPKDDTPEGYASDTRSKRLKISKDDAGSPLSESRQQRQSRSRSRSVSEDENEEGDESSRSKSDHTRGISSGASSSKRSYRHRSQSPSKSPETSERPESRSKSRHSHRESSSSSSRKKSRKDDKDRDRDRERARDKDRDRESKSRSSDKHKSSSSSSSSSRHHDRHRDSRDRDRDKDRDRSSKYKSRDRSRDRKSSRRDRNDDHDEEDMWVEKEVGVPGSDHRTPPPPSSGSSSTAATDSPSMRSSRPRASAFF